MDVVDLLLGAGAPIDAVDNRGRTALMVAAELGHAELVDLLLGRGADRSIVDKGGKRARDLAANESIREKLGAK
jgi:ankyrin repeat protein